MPTPTGWSPTKLSDLALGVNAKSLVYGEQWASNTISYSFPTASSKWSTNPDTGYGPSNGSGEPWNGFEALDANQRSVVKDVLASWAAVAKLNFVEVTETNTRVGDIRFGFSAALEGDTLAYTYLPGQSADSGDVWLKKAGMGDGEDWQPNSYNYMALLHEVGHALGLKHPFEASGYNDVVAPPAWDTRSHTVMSYSAQAGRQDTHFWYEPTTPMVLDILAIQHLYGANTSWRTGNTSYNVHLQHETIWDAGGIDTLSGTGTLDLREGHGSTTYGAQVIDSYGRNLGQVPNVWIAYGTVIENARGGGLDDVLIGNSVGNKLDGGRGVDRMSGGNGSDIYVVRDTGDVVTEAAGAAAGRHDKVVVYVGYDQGLGRYLLPANVEDGEVGSSSLAAKLTGNALDNRFVSGPESDTLDGGAGIDTVDYSHEHYAVINLSRNEQRDGPNPLDRRGDTLYNIENVVGSPSHDSITGNAGVNRLEGRAGNDMLDGGAGNDTLIGGTGNDTYVVNASGDVVTETSNVATEIDGVSASVTWALGANLENLTLIGTRAIDGAGNTLANTLTGNAAANVLRGGAGDDTLVGGRGNDTLGGGEGSDTMVGGLGNDTYYVDNAGDVVTEVAPSAAEIDTVISSVSRVLGNYQEWLTLTGTAAIDGTGNRSDNVLAGNIAANVLNGGMGNDVLAGGRGNDTLTGGAGLDTFRFTTLPHSTANADIVNDFLSADDRIELDDTAFAGIGPAGALAAAAFYAGSTAHDATDRIIYNQAAGKLYFDADGNGAGSQVLFATVTAGTALTVNDLFVI